MPSTAIRKLRRIFLAAAIFGLAGLSAARAAEPAAPTAPAPSGQANEDDKDLQRAMEADIQGCIRDKVMAPGVCRQIAYAAALAAGLSPKQAEFFTGYREDGQPAQKRPSHKSITKPRL